MDETQSNPWRRISSHNPAEAFHRLATEHHVLGLADLCRGHIDVTDAIRLSMADALAWATRLRFDVIGRDDGMPKSFLDGARWARHRVVHGDAHLVAIEPAPELDGSWDSPDILWNDPEVGWNGRLASDRTARFAQMEAVAGDHQPRLRAAYNDSIAGRRVIVVCGLLAGVHTLGRAFVTKS